MYDTLFYHKLTGESLMQDLLRNLTARNRSQEVGLCLLCTEASYQGIPGQFVNGQATFFSSHQT